MLAVYLSLLLLFCVNCCFVGAVSLLMIVVVVVVHLVITCSCCSKFVFDVGSWTWIGGVVPDPRRRYCCEILLLFSLSNKAKIVVGGCCCDIVLIASSNSSRGSPNLFSGSYRSCRCGSCRLSRDRGHLSSWITVLVLTCWLLWHFACSWGRINLKE